MSRSSLWTNFNCRNTEKTRVYLKHSKSPPINVQLTKYSALLPHNPFLQVIPHTVSWLKSLTILGMPKILQEITPQLSDPAPLLKSLRTNVNSRSSPEDSPTVAATFFDRDLYLTETSL